MRMARYFFDSFDGAEFIRDEVGTDLPDLAAAQNEASRALSEMLREQMPATGRIEILVDVRDESGVIVAKAKAVTDVG